MLSQKVKQHIDINLPEMNNSKLLLAVSGGVDSMVMLQMLIKLNYEVTVAHCNFKLRGDESDAETQFLEQYLQKHNIPYHIIFFDTEQYAIANKLSIQLAARKLRYDWFYNLLQTQDLDYIVTAHHLDDQVETFLINLTRGTGIDGLMGIPAKNNKILRPFLTTSRNEILDYALQNQIQWRDDSSNASTKYFRNKIRHEVVPVLKQLNSDFLDTFLSTLKHLEQFNLGAHDGFNALKAKIVTQKQNQFYIDLIELKQLYAPEAFLYQFLKPFEFTAWNDIYNLIDALSGKIIYSKNFVLLKNRTHLIVKPIEKVDAKTTYFIDDISDFYSLPFPVFVKTDNFNAVNYKNGVILDSEKLKFPLIVRKWTEGDYFYPFGMNGKKKLSKYFKDEKFSQFQKQDTWLLVQNNNVDIIWVIGYRADKRYVDTQNKNNSLHIQI
jgi:tRNA(Ile)-lysidine synthase